MAASSDPQPGGHQLEPAFGAVSASVPISGPAPRRRRTGLITGILGAVAIGAVCAGVQWGANVGYDEALESFEQARDDAGSSQMHLDESLTSLTTTTETAGIVQAADTGNLVDAAVRDAFSNAVADAMDTQADAAALADESLPMADEKPTWAWELFGEMTQLNDDRDAVSDQRQDYEAARSALSSASDAVTDTGLAAVQSAAAAADAFEAAHVSARNRDILALRNAARWLDDAAVLDPTTADAYVDLETAAVAMLASEKAEIAEKQGALYQSRVEIEAFARGIAPGVLLDFDWSQIVNGFGEGGSMAGYASWWYGDPGYANIELSNSVAEQWPSDRSRALVAHEVGHAISVKCEGMYDDSNQGTIEAWATAWAISMGFHDVANGTSAYGPPPQSMIDAAAGCR